MFVSRSKLNKKIAVYINTSRFECRTYESRIIEILCVSYVLFMFIVQLLIEFAVYIFLRMLNMFVDAVYKKNC